MPDNGLRWYIMTHLDMKHFRERLKMENAQRLSESRTIIEPFYPHDYLTGRSNDLANFVFLKTTEEDIYHLVNDKRNMESRIRLMHYLDTDKTKATVSDRIMQAFLQACIKYHGQFEIAPSISSIEAKDKVKITSGPFAGHEASVVRVHLSRGKIHLDLAIPLLSSVMHIRMCNVDKNQVLILNRDSSDAIRTDFIEYTQNHLLDILKHRIMRVEDDVVNRRDADMLTRLYRYRYHEVRNEAASNHFLALMLICAHLCHYTDDEAQLQKRALDALAEINQRSESKAATDTRAYLWVALYISTRNPIYRDAAKKYVQDYQPKSKKLRSFVSLIRTGRKI